MWESRVLRRAFERLELHEGKLSRAVLRGGGGGDVTSLPDPQGSNPLGPPGPELYRVRHSVRVSKKRSPARALSALAGAIAGTPSSATLRPEAAGPRRRGTPGWACRSGRPVVRASP